MSQLWENEIMKETWSMAGKEWEGETKRRWNKQNTNSKIVESMPTTGYFIRCK